MQLIFPKCLRIFFEFFQIGQGATLIHQAVVTNPTLPLLKLSAKDQILWIWWRITRIFTFLAEPSFLLLTNLVRDNKSGEETDLKNIFKHISEIFEKSQISGNEIPFPNHAVEERVETVVGAGKNPPEAIFKMEKNCLESSQQLFEIRLEKNYLENFKARSSFSK